MRLLGRAAFVLFLLLGALIAVSNRQRVELGLWPFADTFAMPLFVLVPVLLLLGVLVGLVLGWFASAGVRRNARQYRREAERLARDAEGLRAELAGEKRAREATATPSELPGAERRALERQAALVDPDQVMAQRRLAQRGP